jgi:hypothetical protein
MRLGEMLAERVGWWSMCVRALASYTAYLWERGCGCGVIVAPAVARFIVRVRNIGYGAACARNGSEQHRDGRLAGLFFLITCEEEEDGGGSGY